MTDDPLVLATFGLVLATVLLVIATAIPAYQRWREVKKLSIAAASRVVPDLNMLKSRLGGGLQRALSNRYISTGDAEMFVARLDREIQMISGIVEHAYEIGLRFANELYIARHLLVEARNEVRAFAQSGRITRREDGDSDEGWDSSRICRAYSAAIASIDAAEKLLPVVATSINGQSFWDRFKAVGDLRESQAEVELANYWRQTNTSQN